MTLYVLVVIPYLVAAVPFFVYTSRKVAWNSADRYSQMRPDSGDKAYGIFVGTLTGLFWPGVLTMIGIRAAVRKTWRAVTGNNQYWTRPKPIDFRSRL